MNKLLRFVKCTACMQFFDDLDEIIISRRALAREGDYDMMPVCPCVSVSRRFLKNYYSYRFFVN